MTLLVMAGLASAVTLWILVATIRAHLAMHALSELHAPAPSVWPSVSIIVPACDEEPRLNEALRSLAAQDYPDLEIVCIDDRSTDRTGEIADAVAAQEPRVTVVHVTELPQGWLGKLHALDLGVKRSRGDWMLFADADVELDPSTVKRAVAVAQAKGLDLLSAMPHVRTAGLLGDSVFNVLTPVAHPYARLWKIEQPSTDVCMAVGAFILVRRAAFERTPGFEWLKLEVADDMGLALMVNRHGGRAAMVNGRGLVRIEWYRSFGEMLNKTQKNFYAIIGSFSATRLFCLAAAALFLAFAPALAFIPTTIAHGWLVGALGWGALVIATLWSSAALRRPLLPAFFPQLGLALVAVMMVRSAFIGVRAGGILWRGKLYPTALLKGAQRVKL